MIVGLAERQSFAQQCLTDNKLKTFNEILNDYERAESWLYFIGKLTPGDRFCRPSTNGHDDVRTLENILSGLALARNRDLNNIKGTKFLLNMNVPGSLNTEPGQVNSYAVQEIRSFSGV